ncbi:MAG: hypothetical protein JXA52_03475 [Planctomycetes bacterium]|nr:hypothetical protein [Planctomycetota bacterium]
MAGDWKKSKGMMIILIIIIAVGIYSFMTKEDPNKALGKIKKTYICAECGARKEIFQPDFREVGYPPYHCDACGADAMWPGYYCTRCKDENGENSIYLGIIDLETPVYPGDGASEEEMAAYQAKHNAFINAMMNARCPKCGITASSPLAGEIIGPEAQAEIDRMEAVRKSRLK